MSVGHLTPGQLTSELGHFPPIYMHTTHKQQTCYYIIDDNWTIWTDDSGTW